MDKRSLYEEIVTAPQVGLVQANIVTSIERPNNLFEFLPTNLNILSQIHGLLHF